MEIRIKYTSAWLFLFFLALTEFGNCLSSIAGISSNDIAFLIGGAGAIYYIFKYKSKPWDKSIAIIAIVLILSSSYQSLNLYGQNFILGIRAQRFFAVCWLAFIALQKLIAAKKVSFQELKKIIYIVVYVQFVICLIQYTVGSNHYFMTSLVREGFIGMRIYIDTMFITLAYALSVNEIYKGQGKLADKIIFIGAIIIFVFVSQSRMGIIIAILSAFAPVFFMKGLTKRRITLLLIGTVGVVYFLNTEMAKSLFDAINGNDNTGSITTRYMAQNFYLSVLKEHPILGGGYINSQHAVSVAMSGINQGFFVVDNGIYGFLFLFGFIGSIWAFMVYGKIVKTTFREIKHEDYFLLIVLIRLIISLPTGVTWFYEWYSITTVITLLYAIEKKRRRLEIQ